METTLTPRLPVAASLTFGELADAYMLAYQGRDPSRAHRVEFWKSLLGKLPVLEVSADHIDAGVAELERRPARTFMGRRADGSPNPVDFASMATAKAQGGGSVRLRFLSPQEIDCQKNNFKT